MRADDSTAADVFVLELPELQPIVGIDEELIASSVRSDRGRLAHLSLRFRSTEAEVVRLERELAALMGEDHETIAQRGEFGALRARIDGFRSGSDADLLSARAAAAARVSGAIDEATDILASASASLGLLVESVEQERADAAARRLDELVAAGDPGESVVDPVGSIGSDPIVELDPAADSPEPEPGPDIESFGAPVLLSESELESFIDRLEARAVAGSVGTPPMSGAGVAS